MNKRHYEHTLPNIRGSLSNTYDTSEETSAIPLKKMKPKNEAYHIPYIRKK